MTPSEVMSSQLPVGFASLRYVDLSEMPPFVNHDVIPSRGLQRDVDMIRFFLVLPKLELLRQATRFKRNGKDNLFYIFEWQPKHATLRESIMSFSDITSGSSLLAEPQYWRMKTLKHSIGSKILNYECGHCTARDVQALTVCAGHNLEKLTSTTEMPSGICQYLRAFSRLKSPTLSAECLCEMEGWLDWTAESSPFPASLEELMIHSGAYAQERPRHVADMQSWTTRMNKIAADLISALYVWLAMEQLPKLTTLCLTQIWRRDAPEMLDPFTTCCHNGHIQLHIWSGHPSMEARICPSLCGRFVPTTPSQAQWPSSPRAWNHWSTYDWVEGQDTTSRFGEPYPWLCPMLDDRQEIPSGLLQSQSWGTSLGIRAASPAVTAHIDCQYGPGEDRDDGMLDEEAARLADHFHNEFRVEDDKARRVRESMELGQKVVSNLGGGGAKFVCQDFGWRRV